MNEQNVNHTVSLIELDDLNRSSEAFIASANRDLIPVVSIDGNQVGNGKIGPVYQQLMDMYSKEIHSKNK